MKKTFTILILMGLFWYNPVGGDAAHGFDYNSITGNDMAAMVTFRKSEADYEDSNDNDVDIERKTLMIGVSKTIQSKAKVFGSFNWAMDGEIDDTAYELDHGYSITGGGSYTFFGQPNYTISGFGQLEYFIEEEYEYSDADLTATLDGYEIIAGVLGKYNFNPNFSAYGIIQLMLISDLTGEISGPGIDSELDFERDNTLGFKIGGMYDQSSWFAKLELSMGVDSGFALGGGMKF